MATQSIFKNVKIAGRKQCLVLVKALEKAEHKARTAKNNKVIYHRSVSEMSREDIRKHFGGKE